MLYKIWSVLFDYYVAMIKSVGTRYSFKFIDSDACKLLVAALAVAGL